MYIRFLFVIFFTFFMAELFFPIQMERTFIAIKPDGVQRGLVIKNLKKLGFYLVS